MGEIGFFQDLEMWKQCILNWNGANFFLSSEWQDSDSLLYTDASGALGYGGIFGTKWFQGKWKPHQNLGILGISIAWQELFAIVVACQIWGPFFETKFINSKHSKIPVVMDLLCHLTLLTLRYLYSCNAHSG